MPGANKLMTLGGGGVIIQPASSIASDVTVQVPSQNCTLGIQGPAFSVTKSSGQSISATTTTKVTFDTETFDTNNCFASNAFTPNVAGYYQINVNLGFGSTGAAQVNLFKNGSTSQNGTAITYNSSIGGVMSLSCEVYMNGTTDYLEVYTYSTAGITINSGATNTQFSGFLARAS